MRCIVLLWLSSNGEKIVNGTFILKMAVTKFLKEYTHGEGLCMNEYI
jgi:hypothetical protein